MALGRQAVLQATTVYFALVAAASHAAAPPGTANAGMVSGVKEMIGNTTTFRIDDVDRYSDDFVIAVGVPFTVKGGKGVERWELQETATPLGDDAFALDILVKCGGALVSQHHVTTRQGQHISIKSDGQGCTAKPEAFEAVVMLVHVRGMAGERPGAVDVTHYQVWCKVYVTEQGLAKTVQVLSVEPHTAADLTISEAVKRAVLTWEFKPDTKNGRPVAGYINLPVEWN